MKASLPFQAKEYLHHLIEIGTFQPGQQLPAEDEFANQLGISRPTLREALYKLEGEGMIVRKHGVGTFISPGANLMLDNGLEVLESIERTAERMGMKTHMGQCVIEERIPTTAERIGLGLDPSEHILSVARPILLDDQLVAYLWDGVPLDFLRQSDLDESFTGSVLDIFLSRGHPVLAYSYTKLAAIAATSDLAVQMGISHGEPLMQFEAKLCTPEHQVVDISISYFIPGFFTFHIVRRIGAKTG